MRWPEMTDAELNAFVDLELSDKDLAPIRWSTFSPSPEPPSVSRLTHGNGASWQPCGRR